MRCTECGMKEATTQVVTNHNGDVKKMFLCDDCAQKYAHSAAMDEMDMLSDLIGSPMGLLSGLGGFFSAPAQRPLVCPDCQTTSEEFLRNGFVGCPRCYEVFEPLVVKTVQKLQQSDRHIGKRPGGAKNYVGERDRLRAELNDALEHGDYARVSSISNMLGKLDGEGAK